MANETNFTEGYSMLGSMGYSPFTGIPEDDGRFIRPEPIVDETPEWEYGGGGIPSREVPEISPAPSPAQGRVLGEVAKPSIDISKITSMEDYIAQGTKKFKLDQTPYQRASAMFMEEMPGLAKSFSGGRYNEVTDMPKDMQDRFYKRLQQAFPKMVEIAEDQYNKDKSQFETYGKLLQAKLKGASDLAQRRQLASEAFTRSVALKQVPAAESIKSLQVALSKMQFMVDDKGRYQSISPDPAMMQNFKLRANQSGYDVRQMGEKWYLVPMQRSTLPSTTTRREAIPRAPSPASRQLGDTWVGADGRKRRINPETGKVQVLRSR